MMAINTQKVVVGGLAGGVVLSVLDFVINGILLAERNEAAMNALNPSLMANLEGTGPLVGLVVIDFLLAAVIVWTYAAIRPRFGPGPKTAFIAGLQPWLIFGLVYGFMTLAGMYEWSYYWLGAVVTLVLIQAAAQVGAKLYTEE